MKEKHILWILAMVIIIAFALSACVRPASKPPKTQATATGEGQFPVPGSTEDVMSQLESLATQTALAMQGGTPLVATQTPPPQLTPGAPEATQPAPPAVASPTPAAAVSTPRVVPTATPGIPSTWTLQKGEHPYCIARRFNVNPSELLAQSGLSAGGTYPPGTVLKIPQTGNHFPGNRALRDHPDTYTAASGETVFSIACLYGDADPYAIMAANGLDSPNVKAGQELYIP